MPPIMIDDIHEDEDDGLPMFAWTDAGWNVVDHAPRYDVYSLITGETVYTCETEDIAETMTDRYNAQRGVY